MTQSSYITREQSGMLVSNKKYSPDGTYRVLLIYISFEKCRAIFKRPVSTGIALFIT